TRFRSRTDAYYSEFNQTRLLTTSHFSLPGVKHVEDSLAPWKTQKFNARAAFDTLSYNDRGTTISRALSFAREGTSFMIEKSEALVAEAKNLRKYEAERYKRFTLPF